MGMFYHLRASPWIEKSLYAHILNLTASWQVKALSLDEKVGSVTVTVGIAENVLLSCPTCGKTCPVHDHRHRKWRHLDTCQFTTVVEADVPRIMCPDHGCQTLPVPWAGPGSRYTLLFESFVISWLKISTTDAVRKQLRLSWNAVDNIMQRAVQTWDSPAVKHHSPHVTSVLMRSPSKRDISTSPSSLIHRARRWNSGMIAVLKVWRVTQKPG
ncbi:transposase [Klebsiella pneumoniae subsp. ozaenae]|uniref:Transposase n=1 Tax=Klebsiella pneumoniae subsp. ozaenae TaxID=574 RepID=A0A378BLX9_KLEPO|nr:transposase [Klebsiella pneumoniae subsp. ozaenae]